MVWDSYKHKLLTYNLETALTNRPDGFHPDALIFRFLNNNDTGPRFITQFGEGMTRVATALLLTLPGIPCIYTGDEVGEEFRPYHNPEPLSWEEHYPGLREYHQKLIALRKPIPSLYSRFWQAVEIKPIPQEVFNVIIGGVGGQGNVVASQILGQTLVDKGYVGPSEKPTVLRSGAERS